MTRRAPGGAKLGLFGVAAALLAAQGPALGGCYGTDNGVEPPLRNFYYPTGLAVSPGGNALYAVNSNFDLQYAGGTIQSYDLFLVRRHVLKALRDPRDPELPRLRPAPEGTAPCGTLLTSRPEGRPALGESCTPPVDSTFYVRDAAQVGAFATDLQRAPSNPARPVERLFVPVRGNASLTWIDVARDTAELVPATNDPVFTLDCGVRDGDRCAASHTSGSDPDELGNTRRITMPGEPFGLAFVEDGSAAVVTHQNDTKTSLFSTGLGVDGSRTPPALQFVVDGVGAGGVAIAQLPHDPAARPACGGDDGRCSRPAFLQASRVAPEMDLLRYYADESGGVGSSLRRPFLVRESAVPVGATAGEFDLRSLVVDPTPRLACKAGVRPADPGGVPRSEADVARDLAACGRRPARLFVASRAPAALLVGEVGEATADATGGFDPDRVTLRESVPLSSGPSRLYLAPVVEADGRYGLRVFVVCFDSATIFVYDPERGRVENTVRVGSGPFAMAFDPFDLAAVAARAEVPFDAREPGLRRYRFAYVASFTNSFVQVLDLDNGGPDRTTFQALVYSLGEPKLPKGSK